jgi:nitrate reductase NapAB chaperone NapD
MPICSYLVIPEAGATARVSAELSRIPGCDVIPAQNRELLILITETGGREADEALRKEVEGLDGVEALVFTFGEIDSMAVGDSTGFGRLAKTRPRPAASRRGREDAR